VDSFTAAGDLITALLMMAFSSGWPPVAAGSFWVMVGLWGIVSILFDDEVPRGIPGLEEINEIRARAEAKYPREHKG
jgi:hypothetical protein